MPTDTSAFTILISNNLPPPIPSGVEVQPKPSMSIVPEISHGAVALSNVHVPEENILPGDGYNGYMKPFRSIEDIHVYGALLGYCTRVSLLNGWPQR